MFQISLAFLFSKLQQNFLDAALWYGKAFSESKFTMLLLDKIHRSFYKGVFRRLRTATSLCSWTARAEASSTAFFYNTRSKQKEGHLCLNFSESQQR
jgi:hypothetical protein